MFSKTNLISTVVTALWAFLGGYLLWGVLALSYLSDHLGTATGTMKETPDFLVLAFGCLVVGFAFSSLYGKWARGAHSASQGAQFGNWVGILIGFGGGVIDFATSNLLDMSGTFVNAIIYIIYFIIMGILASMVYKKVGAKSD